MRVFKQLFCWFEHPHQSNQWREFGGGIFCLIDQWQRRGKFVKPVRILAILLGNASGNDTVHWCNWGKVPQRKMYVVFTKPCLKV